MIAKAVFRINLRAKDIFIDRILLEDNIKIWAEAPPKFDRSWLETPREGWPAVAGLDLTPPLSSNHALAATADTAADTIADFVANATVVD